MMKIRLGIFAAMLAAGSLIGSAANATVLYTNGPINGTLDAGLINDGFQISDSFVFQSPGTPGSASVGIWTDLGTPMSQINWSIGTTVDGSDVASGTSSVTDASTSIPNSGLGFYTVDEDTFALSGVPTLSAGTTYWLTLSDAVGNGDQVYWDLNQGPSASYANGIEEGSESFALCDGSSCAIPAAVPEPSSLPMLLMGLGFIGGALSFFRKKTAKSI